MDTSPPPAPNSKPNSKRASVSTLRSKAASRSSLGAHSQTNIKSGGSKRESTTSVSKVAPKSRDSPSELKAIDRQDPDALPTSTAESSSSEPLSDSAVSGDLNQAAASSVDAAGPIDSTNHSSPAPAQRTEDDDLAVLESTLDQFREAVTTADGGRTADGSDGSDSANPDDGGGAGSTGDSAAESDDFTPYGDEIELIPVVARTLTSPIPAAPEHSDVGLVLALASDYARGHDPDADAGTIASLRSTIENEQASREAKSNAELVEEHAIAAADNSTVGAEGRVEDGGDPTDDTGDDDVDASLLLSSRQWAGIDVLPDLVGRTARRAAAATGQVDGKAVTEQKRQRGRGWSAGRGQRTPIIRPTSPTAVSGPSGSAEGDFSAAGTGNGGEVRETGADGGMVATGQVTGAAGLEAPAFTAVSAEAAIEEGIDREAVIMQIKTALDLKEKFRVRNTFLQNKLGEYFRRKRAEESHDGEKSVADQEQRYANCMSALAGLRTEYETLNATNQKVVNEYKVKLEERIAEAQEKSIEFNRFKRSIALSAENSRTGKPIPGKVVEQLEATEGKKDSDVIAVRLEHIKLRNKLRRHEQLLRQKEELADGLHLIDFEQLKIENQTYNEKIEERNEELLKLRKKITNLVQVLTHVKEKLHFVQNENIVLKSSLAQLDQDVSHRRDSLPVAKQERDALRNSNITLRQKNGLLGNAPLLRDFEDKVDDTAALHSKIDELRSTHANLAAETLAVRRKIQKKMVV